MNELQTTKTNSTDDAAMPPPANADAAAGTGAFSLDGFLAEGESRTVKGDGGYTYQQSIDGTITIVGGPKNVGTSYPPGDPVNEAITKEIEAKHGPFPAPEAAPSESAPAESAPAESAPASGGLIPSLDDIVAGVGGIVSGIGDAISGVGDAISGAIDSFFGGDEEAPAAEAPVGDAPATDAPATEAPATESPAPQAPASTTPEFLSQMDNTFDKGGVHDSNMCTVTSLAMQLHALCGGPDAAKQQTAALIKGKGATPPADLASAQTEDVLMIFFDTLASQKYWDQFTKSTEAPFYGGWRNAVPEGTKFHQSGACQAHVLGLYNGITSSNVSRLNAGRATVQEFLEKDVKPEMDKGVTFAMSTKLTGGHFVTLVEILPGAGVIIHDPYGAKTSAGHVINGTSAKSKADNAASRAELEVRFSKNPENLAALEQEPEKARGNWGERNYFTFAEVEKWKIGDYGTKAGKA